METPVQRLASAHRDVAALQQRRSSPIEQIRRKNLSADEANWEKDHDKRVQDQFNQVQSENVALAKMHDVSGRKSPLATSMTPVKGSNKVSK